MGRKKLKLSLGLFRAIIRFIRVDFLHVLLTFLPSTDNIVDVEQ